MKKLFFCLALFLWGAIAFAQQPTAEPVPRTGVYLDTFWVSGNDTLLYRMLLPPGFSFGNKYPLVLFLHGMGERGDDNMRQLTHGSKLFLDSIEKYPAIVIFPQCPVTDYWANLDRSKFDADGMRLFKYNTEKGPNPSLSMVMDMLKHYLDQSYIDDARVYLAGLSMGAMGTFDMLWRMPGTFAAAMPICGSGPLDKVSLIRQTPLWLFHGEADKTVDPQNSTKMWLALQGVGGKVRLSMYEGVSHNSWENAFAEPDFFKWLFQHRIE